MKDSNIENLKEIEKTLNKPFNVPSDLLIVSSSSMSSLLSVTQEMAACNQFDVKRIEQWPDLKPEFDIVKLNDQASRLTGEELAIFVDGEESEVAEITDALNIQELNNFLNAVFDGYLHEAIAI